LCLGDSGAIAASAHLHPQRFVALHRQVVEGRLEAARANFFALLPLIRAAFAEPNPAPVKAGLARQGLIGDGMRAAKPARSTPNSPQKRPPPAPPPTTPPRPPTTPNRPRFTPQ
ncbi:dihydrodipicolinate synthase family protein, partial [Morganella morganii subsp. sibonii]